VPGDASGEREVGVKRGATEHPKMMMLASVLGVQKWGAVGIMESVWHFTAKYAPQGDIGKYSDEMIAAGIGWQDDPKRLIEALLGCGWADLSGQGRPIVHDWSEHADDYADKYLARHGLTYADGRSPRRTADNASKTKTRGGLVRTRADKSRESESESVSVSEPPPNPQGGVAGELHSRLLETGKFPNLTLATVAEVVRSFPQARVSVVMEAVPRLAMDAPALRIQAPDRWLRARFSEIEVDSGAQGDAEVQKKKNAALMLPDLPEHPKRKKGGAG